MYDYQTLYISLKVVFLTILTSGCKPAKHAVRLSNDDDDSTEDDPIKSLEWDPLSMDCLLVCSKQNGIALVEVNRTEIIMRFRLPSASTSTYTLSWVNSAPGAFLTGGQLVDWNCVFLLPI